MHKLQLCESPLAGNNDKGREKMKNFETFSQSDLRSCSNPGLWVMALQFEKKCNVLFLFVAEKQVGQWGKRSGRSLSCEVASFHKSLQGLNLLFAAETVMVLWTFLLPLESQMFNLKKTISFYCPFHITAISRTLFSYYIGSDIPHQSISPQRVY